MLLRAILISLFIADATVAHLRRIAQRERWCAAHRSHAYQWLARSRFGHAGVTSLCWACNLFVLFPLAYWSVSDPELSNALAAVTLLTSMIRAFW